MCVAAVEESACAQVAGRRSGRCIATHTNGQQGDSRMAHETGARKKEDAVMRALGS